MSALLLAPHIKQDWKQSMTARNSKIWLNLQSLLLRAKYVKVKYLLQNTGKCLDSSKKIALLLFCNWIIWIFTPKMRKKNIFVKLLYTNYLNFRAKNSPTKNLNQCGRKYWWWTINNANTNVTFAYETSWIFALKTWLTLEKILNTKKVFLCSMQFFQINQNARITQ